MSKKTLAALVAELVGTFVLAIVVLSVTRYGLPIFTALAAAVALGTLVTGVGALSGGHFNPAITLGVFSLRRIGLVRTISYLAAQAVGAVLAWKLYEWFVDQPVTLAVTEFDWRVFTAELVGTAVFGFVVASAIYKKLDGYFASATIGWGLFLGATISSLVASAGVVNPAVAISLGFRPENAGYLAYLLGPIVGGVVGMNFYRFAFTDDMPKLPVRSAASAAVVSKPATKAKKAAAKKPARSTARKPAARKRATTRSRR